MIRVKSCRRCGGDLLLEADSLDTYWTCLQCGYIAYQPPSEPRPEPVMRSITRPVTLGLPLGTEALIMGEDMDSCLALATYLNALGLRPMVAPSWDAGWQMLPANRYSVVFIDADGTYISALASAKRIKRLWPRTRIAIAIEWDNTDAEVLLKTVDWVVHKPVSGAELWQTVESDGRAIPLVSTNAA